MQQPGIVPAPGQTSRLPGDLAYEGGIEAGKAMLAGQHVSFEHRVTNAWHSEAGG